MNVAVWAVVFAAVSSVGSIAGAAASWVQAGKSRRAARDADEALATILRPELVIAISGGLSDQVNVGFNNVARHDALDVRAEIRLTDGRKVGEGEYPRIPGQIPNTWAGEAVFNLKLNGLPTPEKLDDGYDLIAVLRFTDERARTNWRQEIRVTRTLVDERGTTHLRTTRVGTSLPVAA